MVSEDVIHDESVIREAAARALVAALADNRGYAEAILKQLLALYEEKLYVSHSLCRWIMYLLLWLILINQSITLLSLKRICIVQLQYMGWSQQNASEFQMYPL